MLGAHFCLATPQQATFGWKIGQSRVILSTLWAIFSIFLDSQILSDLYHYNHNTKTLKMWDLIKIWWSQFFAMSLDVQRFKKWVKKCKIVLIFALFFPIILDFSIKYIFFHQFLSNLIKTNTTKPKLKSFSKIAFFIWWHTCNSVSLRVVVSNSPYGNQTGCQSGCHGNQINDL